MYTPLVGVLQGIHGNICFCCTLYSELGVNNKMNESNLSNNPNVSTSIREMPEGIH